MKTSSIKNALVIWLTFLVALILQIIPWPGEMNFFRPSWLFLVIAYWVMALPHRVNVGTALILGILWDALLGSTLGIRGMMMSVVIYIVAVNFLMLRNMALWQQALLITLLSVLLQLLIFIGENVIQESVLDFSYIWGSVINFFLWPWLFYLLRRIRRRWHVK